mmetsp:Transcript_6732/g.14873  ORF Transcript_6732/g.14873 Transcript_6732/m.14873 type:complete len:231 (+) Transcript_6732:45-737(+)
MRDFFFSCSTRRADVEGLTTSTASAKATTSWRGDGTAATTEAATPKATGCTTPGQNMVGGSTLKALDDALEAIERVGRALHGIRGFEVVGHLLEARDQILRATGHTATNSLKTRSDVVETVDGRRGGADTPATKHAQSPVEAGGDATRVGTSSPSTASDLPELAAQLAGLLLCAAAAAAAAPSASAPAAATGGSEAAFWRASSSRCASSSLSRRCNSMSFSSIALFDSCR